MYYLIQDGVVVGSTNQLFGLPSGMTAVESPLTLDSDRVYFDRATEAIKAKPERPSPNHVWDGQQWYEYIRPEYTPPPPTTLSYDELIQKIYQHLQALDPVLAQCLLFLVLRMANDERNLTVLSQLQEYFSDKP